MSETTDRAISARFAEASPADGNRLVSPFFKIDPRTAGIAQVSNMGATPIKAGFAMKLANVSNPAVTTKLLAVPPGGTATIDLRPYLNELPDNVTPQGCIELVHNGSPGSVCGTFTSYGDGSEISMAYPFEGGPPSPGCAMMVFPNTTTVESGDPTEISVFTGGCPGGVSWSTPFGDVTPLPQTDPDVSSAMWNPPPPDPEDPEPETFTIQITSASGSGTTTVTLQKVKLTNFETLDANGNPRIDSEGNPIRRLNPDGGTRFRLTGRSNDVFPAGNLIADFGDITTPVTVVAPNTVEGVAPAQSSFIGDVGKIVVRLNEGGGSFKKVSKAKNVGAYYAFDPPSTMMTVTPNALDRAGGDITITGSGFRQFGSGSNAVKPEIDIGGIVVKDVVVNPSGTQITATLRTAPRDVPACGSTPCLPVRVINPGGKKSDRVESGPIFSLLKGPAPLPETLRPPGDISTGGVEMRITGSRFYVVGQVKVGLAPALPTCPDLSCWSRSFISVIAPPNCAGTREVRLIDVDNVAADGTPIAGGGFTYNLSPIVLKEGDEDLDGRDETLVAAERTMRAVYRVGPQACETLTADPADLSLGMNNCLRVSVRPMFSAVDSTEASAAFLVEVRIDSGACVNNEDIDIRFTLRNGTVAKPVRIILRLRR
jgi:hypothetical protein